LIHISKTCDRDYLLYLRTTRDYLFSMKSWISAAPVIDRAPLKNLKLKAGQQIRFDIRVTGEPPPTKTWYLNKARLDPKDEVIIDNEDYKTKIVISPVSRVHNGVLYIKAENSSGKDEAFVEVLVLGKGSMESAKGNRNH